MLCRARAMVRYSDPRVTPSPHSPHHFFWWPTRALGAGAERAGAVVS